MTIHQQRDQFKSATERRDFLKLIGGFGALALTFEPSTLFTKCLAASSSNQPQRLSYTANRSMSFEGPWAPRLIEGRIPSQLTGSLYRNGPGQKDIFGVNLKHLFDGDAYLSVFNFKNSTVTGMSKFLATKERLLEQSGKAMKFHDFGTACPFRTNSFKNAPSVNIAPIGAELVALSEGDHPIKIDPLNLDVKGAWNFDGGLSNHVTFTAHPKVDPETGDIYAYGISKSLRPHLMIYRISGQTSQITLLHSINLNGFYPVHDFLMTKNYLIFVMPPVYVSLLGLITGTSSISDNIVAEEDKPMRIFVVRKDGRGQALTIYSEPTSVIFHHCNAVESEDGNSISFVSMEIENASVFNLVRSWSQPALPAAPRSWMTRFELDLTRQTVTQRIRLTDGNAVDFPAIDNRLLGHQFGTTYALEVIHSPSDPLGFNSLLAWDFDGKNSIRVQAGQHEIFGEPVFVPEPGTRPGDCDRAWIMHLGYDGTRDETFLDIRRASNLDQEARVWLGFRIPLGFHGNFIAKA